jgi:regulator of protease activity HflC (stomatin/prohibitin superfamily)
MSRQPPHSPDGLNGLGLPIADGATATLSPPLRGRGAASVTLRDRSADDGAGGRNSGPFVDPATRSLADALRITYRLLQATMVVLVILYLLSGFQAVKESERGIRLLFGQVKARDLSPGFQFSLPAPLGELVRVGTGAQTMDINKAFFPNLSEDEEKQLLDKNKGAQTLADGGNDSLDPDSDGQLLTADGSIVHTRWSVTYQRAQAWETAQNIEEESERRIVTAAACQGIVHAAAGLTIDDILKKQVGAGAEGAPEGGGGGSLVELRARENAQRALDKIESGIQITQLVMTTVIPPRRVMRQFEEVQANQSRKTKLIDEARTERADKLTQAAGDAAPLLLRLIERYESELALAEPARAAATLALIDRVLLREAIELDGRTLAPQAFGRVSSILDEARQRRSSVVSEAKEDAAYFQAKRELFNSNPLVMIHGDWSDAFRTFLARPSLQTIWLPPNIDRQTLQINRDPSITAAQQEERNRKQVEEAAKARELKRARENFERRTDAESRTREQ